MERDIITIGYHKGEMDFGINASIAELSLEQMNQLRQMTMVAIGQAESMWRSSRPQTKTDSLTPSSTREEKV